MKKCNQCGTMMPDNAEFCTMCGNTFPNQQFNQSPHINQVPNNGAINQADNSVPNAYQVPQQQSQMQYPSVPAQINTYQKARTEYYAPNNTSKIRSNTANYTAVKTNLNRKQSKIIIITATVIISLIAMLLVVTHIHKCDECNKVYFGSRHQISFFGETENVCKDCYNDFYSFDW